MTAVVLGHVEGSDFVSEIQNFQWLVADLTARIQSVLIQRPNFNPFGSNGYIFYLTVDFEYLT